MKYIRNVLDQYGKDGLAFQRYGRLHQDGLGDDILSGNSLSIVGLYQSVYGINPLYNRLYLNPHITPELSGTTLNYNYRGKILNIDLNNNSYTISDGKFKVTADKDFGYFATTQQLSYFNTDNSLAALQATTTQPLALNIHSWASDKMVWEQEASGVVSYVLHQVKPNSSYAFSVDGKPVQKLRSNGAGDIIINITSQIKKQHLSISRN